METALTPWLSLSGSMLFGASAVLMMITNGRMARIGNPAFEPKGAKQ